MYDRLERDRLVTRLVLLGIAVFLAALLMLPGDKPNWLAVGGVGVGLLILNALRYQLNLRPSTISITLGVLAILISLFWLTGNSFVLIHKALPPAPVLIGLGLLIMIYGETFFEGRIA